MPTPLTESSALLAHLVAAAALLALLVTAYRHPRARTEAAVGLAAAAAVLATGTLDAAAVGEVLARLGPVVAFLCAILVVADVCARAGVFTAAAGLVVDASRGNPARLLTGVFLLAALVTTVLSLDATVVLLAPVVVGAALALGVPTRPGAQACVRMANSASLLLPVSNLTTLLAMPYLDLTFTGFAATMAPVLAAVLVVEYVVLRVVLRADLAVPASRAARPDAGPLPRVPVAALAVMLAGFAVLSPWGVEPAWVAGATAVALVAWAWRRGTSGPREALHAAHPAFALFVLCLGVVVAAVSEGPLVTEVRDLLPAEATSFTALLGLAVLATLLANLLTNLSATLLLVPLVAPLGSTAVLAALVGLNVGAGLTYTGSLANLLWRRTLVRQGHDPGLADFHRLSLVATPLAVVAAVAVLALNG